MAAQQDEKCHLIPKERTNDVDQYRRQRYLFITLFFVSLLFRSGEGMAAVIIKQFIYSWCKSRTAHINDVGHANYSSNSSEACGKHESSTSEDAAQKMAASWEQYFNIVYAVLVFIAISTYGTMSDYIGRKFFLCLALFGFTLKCANIAVTIYFDLHIAWLFVGYVVDGICGASYSVSYLCYVSTADVMQKPGPRVFGIAVMEMFAGLGILSTEFCSGYFIEAYGYFYPMITATGLCFLSFLFTFVLFQETLTEDVKDHTNGHKRLPSCTTLLRRYTSFYVSSGTREDKEAFWLCLITFATMELGRQGIASPLTLYQLGFPFCWPSTYIGWYSAANMFATTIMGCIILKPLLMCFHPNNIACIGLVSGITSNVIVASAKSTPWIFGSLGFAILSYIPKSVLRGLASSRAPSNLQGAILAGLESAELVSKLVSTPGALAIYSATVDTYRGLVFFVVAGVNGLALVFMIMLTCLLRKQSDKKNKGVIQSH